MNKIIIGSIVLCKLMILEPQNTMTTISSSSSSTTTSRGATGNQILDQFNILDKNTIEKKSQEIEKDGDHVAIVGEVQDIRSVTKYLKNPETGKYKKTQFELLIVKSDKINKLFVDPRSCGLADELLEKEQTKADKTNVVEKKKEQNHKQKITKKEINTLSKAKVGEYIVVPADTELGSDFEVITDEKLEKEIMQAIQKNEKVKEQSNKAVEIKEKTLEEKLYENQSTAFSNERTEVEKKDEIVEVKVETRIEETKTIIPVQDLEMFDFFGKEENKPLKKNLETKKIVKEETKKIEVKKEIRKPKVVKQPVNDEITSEEKSILSEALDIAF